MGTSTNTKWQVCNTVLCILCWCLYRYDFVPPSAMYKIYNLTVAHKKVKLSLYRSKKAPRAPEG